METASDPRPNSDYKPAPQYNTDDCLPWNVDTIEEVESPQGNVHQAPESSMAKLLQGLSKAFLDTWVVEIMAMALAVVAWASILAILLVYRGRPLTDWSHSISLNTVLSFLATIMKGAILLPVGSCLGQLKWIWYRDEKMALEDFQRFDAGSRGVLGALSLIWCTRVISLASVGAFVIILSLGMDAFVQQSVSYPLAILPNPYPDYMTNVQLAQSYRSLDEISDDMIELKAAIYEGAFYSNAAKTGVSITGDCPTGNCTYPYFGSLGVCSTCADISDKLIEDCIAPADSGDVGSCIQKVSLPNGLFLLNHAQFSDVLNMTSVSSGYDTFDLSSFEPWMLSISLILTGLDTFNQANSDPTLGIDYFSEARAYDCIFNYCVKIFGASTFFGVYQETLIDTYLSDVSSNFSSLQSSVITIPQNWNDTLFPTPDPMNRTFTIDGQGGFLMGQTLGDLLTSSGYVWAEGAFSSFKTDIGQTIYQRGADAVPETISNISTTMTNNMRIRAESDFVFGSAELRTPHIHFRWPWLVLPVIALFGTSVLLLGTIWRSRRTNLPCWKNSILAVMENGVRMRDVDGIPDGQRVMIETSGLQKRAEDVSVRLRLVGDTVDHYELVT